MLCIIPDFFIKVKRNFGREASPENRG
jgi:hypothetical protein